LFSVLPEIYTPQTYTLDPRMCRSKKIKAEMGRFFVTERTQLLQFVVIVFSCFCFGTPGTISILQNGTQNSDGEAPCCEEKNHNTPQT